MKTQSKKIQTSVATRYGMHLVVLEPDEKKGYIVTAPGLEGVITWGRNISHAKEMAKEAIELCIECLAEESARHTKSYRQHTIRESIAV